MALHYSDFLACCFIRLLRGDGYPDFFNINPQDLKEIKVTQAYATQRGHHIVFQFKCGFYEVDINFLQPSETSIKIVGDLTVDELLKRGGL